MAVEGFGADQEVHVLGRAWIPIGPDSEPTNHDMPHIRDG